MGQLPWSLKCHHCPWSRELLRLSFLHQCVQKYIYLLRVSHQAACEDGPIPVYDILLDSRTLQRFIQVIFTQKYHIRWSEIDLLINQSVASSVYLLCLGNPA